MICRFGVSDDDKHVVNDEWGRFTSLKQYSKYKLSKSSIIDH